MRMWMIPPQYMCMQHITGEHGEIHKHRHNFVKKHSISGRIYPVIQVSPWAMKARHDELVKFLKNHKSPYEMPDISYLPPEERYASVDVCKSALDLSTRCEECRVKLLKWNYNG